MTRIELWNRIKLTFEEPPCIIEPQRRNGFAWWENGVPIATVGVAVAMVGHDDLDERFVDRAFRARLLGLEWHYLMHFEMAINSLCSGSVFDYNRTKLFPVLPILPIPAIVDEDNFWILKKLFI